MTQHHHVPTVPGEPVAPEIVDHPIRTEPGSQVQSDDINVPFVALTGLLSAVILFITIASLEAWFYTWNGDEIAAKTKPNEALVNLVADQKSQLQPKKQGNMSIDQAMDQIVARAMPPRQPR